MTEFRRGEVRANGLRFATLEAGDGPLVLCLHGFPDHARSFRHQLPALAAAGFRAVAPYMRGYAPSDAPPDGPYQSAVLGQDAAAMIEALGYRQAAVVGHDWGAVAAYGAATRQVVGRPTLFCGYSNGLPTYIPSARIRRQGGYEGCGANVFFGLPGAIREDAELVILAAVEEACG